MTVSKKRERSRLWYGIYDGHHSQKVRVRGPLFEPIFNEEWEFSHSWYYDFGPMITIGSMAAKNPGNGAMRRMIGRAKATDKMIIIINPATRWLVNVLERYGFHRCSVLSIAPGDPNPTSMALIWYPLKPEQFEKGIFMDDGLFLS